MEYRAGRRLRLLRAVQACGASCAAFSANEVRVTTDSGDIDVYPIIKFMRANQGHVL